MAISTRNTDVSPYIGKLSRSQLVSKKGTYKRKYPDAAPAATDAALTKTVKVGGAKNGGTRTVPITKAPAFYPSEDVKQKKISRKTLRPTKLRSTITPGTVLILLAGRFRGKRVVCLKQLEGSGLLLITGPYKVNGVPLRRVNQAYVIATSTKIDISALTVRSHQPFVSSCRSPRCFFGASHAFWPDLSHELRLMLILSPFHATRSMPSSTMPTSPRTSLHPEMEPKPSSSRLPDQHEFLSPSLLPELPTRSPSTRSSLLPLLPLPT